MSELLWLVVPIVLCVLFAWLVNGRRPYDEFSEAERREKAMKALGRAYDPETDLVLRGKRGSTAAD